MDAALESRFDQLLRRHAELRSALSAAGLGGAEFAKLSKEYSELSPIIDGIEKLRATTAELAAATEMVEGGDDPDMKAMAEEEVRALEEKLPGLELNVKMSLVPIGEEAETFALRLVEDLRDVGLVVDLGYSGNLQRRMRRADRIGARAAVLLGEDELAKGVATVRDLDSGEQSEVALGDLPTRLRTLG